MSPSGLSPTWDLGSNTEAEHRARCFEADWQAAKETTRPDPEHYLPGRASDRPSALLSLLRVDLALRLRAGEPSAIEDYFRRYPELSSEAKVALVYEEFCLREEAGTQPDPAACELRFPEIATMIRETLDIHRFVVEEAGATMSVDFTGATLSPAVRFPEAGQTIAGFFLVEELGRGSFARVFRAEERQLADRPVALKIARTGSREPQTLARLQHTNIVPIHSYRTDPATGLHLLCMPYLGHVTLAHLLSALDASAPRTGSALVSALDELDPPEAAVAATPGRAILAGRSYARAMAGWGANLAEALQFAHERGILHLDIKPSNILVTSDGMPLLLDFNLANSPPDGDEDKPSRFGGTMAYMAPEHLEALISGGVAAVDCRADIFALGVVLYEALGGDPFTVDGANLSERLRNALASRRSGPPRLKSTEFGVSPAFETVIRRCLAPDPDDRYESAGDLAVDLRAVAEDEPLRHAREPWASRMVRSLRRNRWRIALAAPMVLLLVLMIVAWGRAQAERGREDARYNDHFQQAERSEANGEFTLAAEQYARASDEIRDRRGLQALRDQVRERRRRALEIQEHRDLVDRFLLRGEALRFALIGLGVDLREASRQLQAELEPFGVLQDPSWTSRAGLRDLDPERQKRLLNEVNELLFLWIKIVVSDWPDDTEMAARALAYCDRALGFVEPKDPWLALRDHCRGVGNNPVQFTTRFPQNPARETSARACFQWSLLSQLRNEPATSLGWLERAVELQPDDYWYEFYLAYHHELGGRVESALVHYGAALALRPRNPWVLLNRAHLYWSQRGAWDRALRDLEEAMALASEGDMTAILLERGHVLQRVGDHIGAYRDYGRVLALGPNTQAGRVARLNRAKLDADAGASGRAWSEYNLLLTEDPSDGLARLGRALLAFRAQRLDLAEADLNVLIGDGRDASEQALYLSYRALARLALGQFAAAADDAEAAYQLDPRPSRQRLVSGARLASGREIDLSTISPDELTRWPAPGKVMRKGLAAADRLDGQSRGHDVAAFIALRSRVVLLSALDRHDAAEAEADRALAAAPFSASAYLLRARVRYRKGDRVGARADLERGLQLEPDDQALLILRGNLAMEEGNPASALNDGDLAAQAGASEEASALRARALFALDRYQESVEAWTQVVNRDPEEAPAFLERARSFAGLGLWDHALADLERAADWADDRPGLIGRIAIVYADCVGHRPERSPRLLGLARRLCPPWINAIFAASPFPGPGPVAGIR
ncbi:protein kinase domain-containing protein [Singulisphaera sp. PoT]|uniref:protein kinase domain-containing protein n=1 Tax=Singulisphaera sp. PoT TaxID=3411797 RepID=UPI003BF59001